MCNYVVVDKCCHEAIEVALRFRLYPEGNYLFVHLSSCMESEELGNQALPVNNTDGEAGLPDDGTGDPSLLHC